MRRSPRALLVWLVLVIGVFASLASSEDETAEQVGTADDPSEQSDGDDSGATGEGEGETDAPDVFNVGDVVQLGDYEIVVHEVTDPLEPSADGFLTPDEGSRWVAVDTEIRNLSEEALSLSTLLQFEVQDSTNAAYDTTITDHDFPSLDGEAPPGGSRRGTVVFQVPADATGLRLNFSGDVFGSGSAAIQLT